jgi:hypothetical protein
VSRIAQFAIVEANHAIVEARKIIARGHQALDRLDRDGQCDDADRSSLARARERLDRAMGAM